MTDSKNKGPQIAGNYTVGYKKPPAEHQFKPRYLRDAAQKTRNRQNEKAPDVAALIARPRKVRRGGKTISMHPFEAELTSLGKRALNGEARATKLFLEYCDIAGLLEAPPGKQTHGVFVLPKGVKRGISTFLIKNYGLPPWDADVYAALEAEFDRDQAHIEELYDRFMEDLKNE